MRLFEGTEFDIPPRCDHCNELVDDCQCEPPPKQFLPPDQQTAVVRQEKRKKGKVVTLVTGLSADDSDLQTLTKTLKDHCGAGGTLKNGQIEIQGNHALTVEEKLAALGYKVR